MSAWFIVLLIPRFLCRLDGHSFLANNLCFMVKFAAPTLGRHISTFRGYQISFSIWNPYYINRFTNHFSIHSQPSYTQKVVLHSITAKSRQTAEESRNKEHYESCRHLLMTDYVTFRFCYFCRRYPSCHISLVVSSDYFWMFILHPKDSYDRSIFLFIHNHLTLRKWCCTRLQHAVTVMFSFNSFVSIFGEEIIQGSLHSIIPSRSVGW
jgi:hypothetical protein